MKLTFKVQKTSSLKVIANLKILDRVYMWNDSLLIWHILWCSCQKVGFLNTAQKIVNTWFGTL